jgi:hypothetical protein
VLPEPRKGLVKAIPLLVILPKIQFNAFLTFFSLSGSHSQSIHTGLIYDQIGLSPPSIGLILNLRPILLPGFRNWKTKKFQFSKWGLWWIQRKGAWISWDRRCPHRSIGPNEDVGHAHISFDRSCIASANVLTYLRVETFTETLRTT